MTSTTDHPSPPPIDRRWAFVGVMLLAAVLLAAAGLTALVWLDRTGGLPVAVASPTPSPTPAPSPGSFAYAELRAAPPLDLTDQNGKPFQLETLRGRPALVFFGYTHCPDVCPATIGVVNQVLEAAPPGLRAVFVSIDPERDDPAAMKQYLTYLPKAYIGLAGTPAEIRRAADGYGASYARVDTGSASGYAMAHTAEIYLIDAAGRLRAHFPFGTEPGPIIAALEALGGGTAVASASPAGPGAPSANPSTTFSASAAPSPTPNPTTTAASDPAGGLRPVIVSTSVWSGRDSPLLLSLEDADGLPVSGPESRAWFELAGPGGERPAIIEAHRVRPPGRQRDMFLAYVDLPVGGPWQLTITATDGRRTLAGSTLLTVVDQGGTVPLGAQAPLVRTPTLSDAAGQVAQVTTDPAPDLRLYQTSTADARAAGKPYVLVVDSWRFRVSPACGRAIQTARYLADRWPEVAFIHLEPYRYSLVTETPTLEGNGFPVYNDTSAAWGLGPAPFDAISVPWIFIVDGNGVLRGKFHGIFGTDEVDVVIADILGQTSG